MTESNNPAGQVLSMMRKLQQLPTNQSMVAIWASLFECKPNASFEIVTKIQALEKTITEAEEALRLHAPGNPAKFLNPLAKVRSLLHNHNMTTTWHSYHDQLDPATMTALEFSDHVLQLAYSKEYPHATDEVRDMIEALNDLLSDCLDSALSADLKKLFTKNLEALRSALINYRIGGEEAISDALDLVTGSIIRHQEEIKNEFDRAEDFLNRSTSIMEKVESLATKAQSAAAIAGPAVTYLLNFFK